MKWSKQGIKDVSSGSVTSNMPTVPFPFKVEDVQEALRARDLERLMEMRERMAVFQDAAIREQMTYTRADVEEEMRLLASLRAAVGEMTTGQAVALSDRQTAPERPLEQRVADARAALASQLKRDPDTGARLAEVRASLNRTREGR